MVKLCQKYQPKADLGNQLLEIDRLSALEILHNTFKATLGYFFSDMFVLYLSGEISLPQAMRMKRADVYKVPCRAHYCHFMKWMEPC